MHAQLLAGGVEGSEAKVDDLHAVLGVQEDVLQLDISVHHLWCGGCVKGVWRVTRVSG